MKDESEVYSNPFMPSLVTSSSFARARESVQRYDISRGNTNSTFSEFRGGVRSWFPEAPSMFSRSTGLPE